MLPLRFEYAFLMPRIDYETKNKLKNDRRTGVSQVSSLQRRSSIISHITTLMSVQIEKKLQPGYLVTIGIIVMHSCMIDWNSRPTIHRILCVFYVHQACLCSHTMLSRMNDKYHVSCITGNSLKYSY